MPMPKFYYDITLLFADSEKDFPVDFDPQRPSAVKKIKRVSRGSFVNKVKSEDGVGVVRLEEFSPDGIEEELAEDVELRDGATYIVSPTGRKSFAKRVSSYAAFRICGRFSSRH